MVKMVKINSKFPIRTNIEKFGLKNTKITKTEVMKMEHGFMNDSERERCISWIKQYLSEYPRKTEK